MKTRGISDQGLKRIAKLVKAQGKDDGSVALDEALRIAKQIYKETHSEEEAFSAAEAYLEDDGNYLYFGVESLPYEETGPLADVEFRYLNAGDTYSSTLCYTKDEGFFISSWGDWLENREREYEEETGERACGYCGVWSEDASRGETCPSCGHNTRD